MPYSGDRLLLDMNIHERMFSHSYFILGSRYRATLFEDIEEQPYKLFEGYMLGMAYVGQGILWVLLGSCCGNGL